MADSTKYGFNEAAVEALSTNISTAYTNCTNGILETLKEEIVDKIATVWYAPEACGFFGKEDEGVTIPESNLKQVVKSTSDAIFDCFDGFRKDIQAAGQNWYDNTSGQGGSTEAGASAGGEGGEVQLATFDKIELDLDVKSISKQDESGNVVLDDSGVQAVEGNLTQVEESIKTKMTAEKEQLDASTAFIGGGQADAIESCFGKLLEAISGIFKWLSEGEDSLASAFGKARQKYIDVASNIASVYNNASFEEGASTGGSSGGSQVE